MQGFDCSRLRIYDSGLPVFSSKLPLTYFWFYQVATLRMLSSLAGYPYYGQFLFLLFEAPLGL